MKRKIGAVAVIVFVIVLVAGSVYERIGEQRERLRYPQVGRSFDIGERRLNLSCEGTGQPTVVFETSSHQAGYSWLAIQRQVAMLTRACWYDRAGYGWSDPSPRPHTSGAIAADLHRLLQAASIAPPYVLVGENQAALHIRVYRSAHSADVAGVVFVNPADVEELEEPEITKGPVARHFGRWTPYVRAAACATVLPAASMVGLSRLLSAPPGSRPTPTFGLSFTQQQELDALSDNPTANASGELCDIEESRRQVSAAGGLGDVPLVVLASTRHMPFTPRDPRDARTVAAYNEAWIGRIQPHIARLSTRGRLIAVDDNQPRARVVQAVRDVLAEIR